MNKKWETPVCNICGSEKYTVVYDKVTYWEYRGQFRVVQCDSCGLTFTSPRPSLNEIGKYYGKENYFGRDINKTNKKTNDVEEREKAYRPVYDIIAKYKKKGKILDIGAGTGLLLSKYKDEGWEVDGVELVGEAVKYAKKQYGIMMRRGDFFDFTFTKNSFDVIVLSGALEHLYNPRETLERTHHLLKKNGLVIFTVPNSQSWGRRIFGKSWFPWQLPRHLYHFSGTTAKDILQRAGFAKSTVKYNYLLQNQYILFQSLRYAKSPKFQKKQAGGLLNSGANTKPAFSLKKQIGKVFGFVFSYSLALVEPWFRKGEVLIVYAQK